MSFMIRSLVASLVAVGVAGCAKGPITTQEIIQHEDSLTVDTSQVPEEWIERSVWKKRIGKTHTIRVKPGNRVKVVLVPE